MKALVDTFNQEKALSRGLLCDCTTSPICGTTSDPHLRTVQGGFDGRGQPTASPMLTAIMSGGVGISGRELYKYR